ncbi:MAG: hypothetical protein HOV81_04660 [Kofleriaceae bacterium]|nr:hypothetical protein [Kofleriaceae bacterium]
MSKLWIVLAAILASGSACRDTERSPTESVEVRKPVESSSPRTDSEHEFANVRSSYETAMRERLNKIDADIAGLATSADRATQETAAKLRAQRDALAKKLDTIGYQAKTGWDEFQAGVTRDLDQLEDDVDAATR